MSQVLVRNGFLQSVNRTNKTEPLYPAEVSDFYPTDKEMKQRNQRFKAKIHLDGYRFFPGSY